MRGRCNARRHSNAVVVACKEFGGAIYAVRAKDGIPCIQMISGDAMILRKFFAVVALIRFGISVASWFYARLSGVGRRYRRSRCSDEGADNGGTDAATVIV